MKALAKFAWGAAFLCVLWFSGVPGRLLAWGIDRYLLPMRIGDVVLERMSGDPPPALETGVLLVVSTERLLPILNGLTPWTRCVPPGFIRNGMSLHAAYAPLGRALPGDGRIPFTVLFDRPQGDPPLLMARYPADKFNTLVENEAAEDLTDREAWLLGHYELAQEIAFATLEIVSEPIALGREHIRRRVLHLHATGRTRYRAQERILGTRATLDVRTTIRVRDLTGRIVLDIIPGEAGGQLAAQAFVDKVRADVNRVAPWLDRSISEKLRESFERSMNRRRNREKVRDLVLPDWAPLDLRVDLALTR